MPDIGDRPGAPRRSVSTWAYQTAKTGSKNRPIEESYERMHNRLPLWCSMLIVLALSACDQEFRLIGDDGVESKGILTIHTTAPHEMTLAIRGEEFAGQWRTTVLADNLRLGHASLHGSNGSTMECDFHFHRGKGDGAGICTDGDGHKYRVIL